MIEELIEVEKKYIDSGLLKLPEGAPVDASLPLEEFLLNLVKVWNRKFPTIDAKSEKFTEPEDKHRSIEDLFRITKFYKPEVTLQEVCKALFDLRECKKLHSLYCGNISKITFFPPGSRGYGNSLFSPFNSKDKSSGIPVDTYLKWFNTTANVD